MKLSDWLPILTHPEIGERICKAAGCRMDGCLFAGDDSYPPELPPHIVAALAFGGLAVLAEMDYPQVCEDRGKWRVVFDFTDPQPKWCDTLPAAVLAAALRVFGGGA